MTTVSSNNIQDISGVSHVYVSDFICDHRALHVSLTCNRVHPERKRIDVRSLKRITYDALEADLIGVNIDRECTDVNIVVCQYDASLSSLLNKHAPSKRIYVVNRPMNDWMTDDILVLEALCRKYESLWRKARLTVHFDMCSESCMAVKKKLVRVNLLYCKRKSPTAMVIRRSFSKLLTAC